MTLITYIIASACLLLSADIGKYIASHRETQLPPSPVITGVVMLLLFIAGMSPLWLIPLAIYKIGLLYGLLGFIASLLVVILIRPYVAGIGSLYMLTVALTVIGIFLAIA